MPKKEEACNCICAANPLLYEDWRRRWGEELVAVVGSDVITDWLARQAIALIEWNLADFDP